MDEEYHPEFVNTSSHHFLQLATQLKHKLYHALQTNNLDIVAVKVRNLTPGSVVSHLQIVVGHKASEPPPTALNLKNAVVKSIKGGALTSLGIPTNYNTSSLSIACKLFIDIKNQSQFDNKFLLHKTRYKATNVHKTFDFFT